MQNDTISQDGFDNCCPDCPELNVKWTTAAIDTELEFFIITFLDQSFAILMTLSCVLNQEWNKKHRGITQDFAHLESSYSLFLIPYETLERWLSSNCNLLSTPRVAPAVPAEHSRSLKVDRMKRRMSHSLLFHDILKIDLCAFQSNSVKPIGHNSR